MNDYLCKMVVESKVDGRDVAVEGFKKETEVVFSAKDRQAAEQYARHHCEAICEMVGKMVDVKKLQETDKKLKVDVTYQLFKNVDSEDAG